MTETGHYTKVISQEQLTSWKQQAKRDSNNTCTEESEAVEAAAGVTEDNKPPFGAAAGVLKLAETCKVRKRVPGPICEFY